MFGALGVVYGDIGTSPLYSLRECFQPEHGVVLSGPNVLGVLSLIVWSLILIVTVKYLSFVMRADNRGEGGILALMALVEPQCATVTTTYRLTWAIALGLFGAALLYGDGIITPAISVLSAVEGLEVATPMLKAYVVPITLLILVALFLVQQQGTARIGRAFGPIMASWFFVLALTGALQIVRAPAVLAAVNPLLGFAFIRDNGWNAFKVLGSVFLVVTGGEALYADMGHFGREPIKLGWYYVVLPALVIQYFGQGALLLQRPDAIANPFYLLAPNWALYPLVALSTAATVIASQALITGAFSLGNQAVQLGYMPRLKIVQTSEDEIGQIYIPFINWAILGGTVLLVVSFETSSRLAAAYGIAVTSTMVITTVLMFAVTHQVWGWSRVKSAAAVAVFLVADLTFFAANVLKIPHGGWLPLVLGGFVYFIAVTWKRGRALLASRLRERTLPLSEFLPGLCGQILARAPGDAVFMSGTDDTTPLPLAQNVRYNKVLHERNLILTVTTGDIPHVSVEQRLTVEELRADFFRLRVRYGFMDRPDVPSLLFNAALPYTRLDGGDGELQLRPDETAFFLGHDTLLATDRPGMALFRERIFAFMVRNSQRASSFFHLPADRVIQIGSVVEL